MGVQRFEPRVVLQRRPPLAPEGAQLFGAGGRVPLVQLALQAQPRGRRGWPIDQRQRFEPRQLFRQMERIRSGPCRRRSSERRRIGVQRIQEQAAGRRIRAVAANVRREPGVHRADRQRSGAGGGGSLHQPGEGREIAYATVAAPAQAVELGGQTS